MLTCRVTVSAFASQPKSNRLRTNERPMEGALRRAPPMAPQRHLVVRDALDALAGPAIRPRVPRQQGQVRRALGALCHRATDRCNEPETESETAEVLKARCSSAVTRAHAQENLPCTSGTLISNTSRNFLVLEHATLSSRRVSRVVLNSRAALGELYCTVL